MQEETRVAPSVAGTAERNHDRIGLTIFTWSALDGEMKR